MGRGGTVAVRSNWRTLALGYLRRPLNRWSDYPSVDLLLTATAVSAHAVVVYRLDAGNVLHWANQSQRLGLYAAGAGMMALIAGFTGTAIAQYGSSTGPVVTALRSAHGHAIRKNWLNISKWLLGCTVLCLVAMAIDSPNSPRGSEWVFEAALVISVAKFARLVFLFDLILSSIDSEVQKPGSEHRTTRLTPAKRPRG
jgi:hypothetical protein